VGNVFVKLTARIRTVREVVAIRQLGLYWLVLNETAPPRRA
jgi:hypothetical protein